MVEYILDEERNLVVNAETGEVAKGPVQLSFKIFTGQVMNVLENPIDNESLYKSPKESNVETEPIQGNTDVWPKDVRPRYVDHDVPDRLIDRPGDMYPDRRRDED